MLERKIVARRPVIGAMRPILAAKQLGIGMKRLALALASAGFVWLISAPASAGPLEDLEGALPQTVGQFDRERTRTLEAAARGIEEWGAGQRWSSAPDRPVRPEDVLSTIRALIGAKARVDAALDRAWSLRSGFAATGSKEVPRGAIREYLRTTSLLIDASGRLRYMLRDVIDDAAYDLDPHISSFHELVDLLAEHRVEIGAGAMSYVLLDPPSDSGAVPYSAETKGRVLRLLAATRDMHALPDLAEFLKQRTTTPELAVMAVETVRRIGLPQDPRPGSDPDVPLPAVTAEKLVERLAASDMRRLAPSHRALRNELLEWLTVRMREGVVDPTYRVGNCDVAPGDWLLMRNPSPYNNFTDISPGLFTHVGVVAAEKGADGKRRFLIVDLPERGDRIPALNVDAYLLRTLHYMFVRHRDPAVGSRMGQAALDMIGNETEFDLTFRTSRVLEMQGKPLKGARINTYCAGFLLLCAQTTGSPRTEFFPIPEFPAGGHCLENLKTLGLSIGDDFVSPSGAVFSPNLQIVGRCEPMYSPDREVKEAVYDHFGQSMVEKKLHPSPDFAQSMRERLARMAKDNPLLALVLARANDVSAHMDLEAAARTAAVVETLDEIADDNMREFLAARDAFFAGPIDELAQQGATPESLAQTKSLRERHSQLWQAWLDGRLTPRDMRVALVDYYSKRGRDQLDARFFPE